MNRQTIKNIVLASAAVLGIGFMTGAILWRNSWIDSLNSQLAFAESGQADTEPEKSDEETVQEQTGISLERKNADDALIDSFLEDTLTWSSRAEYDESRNKAIEHYGISADSGFLKDYMPSLDEDFDFEGKNLNLEYQSMQSYLTSAGADSYSYTACVNVAGKSPAGGQADGNMLILYTISRDGRITEINGYNSNI